MSFTPCPYCEHRNPADSKFCNSCGGTLALAPCPHCGAVNEVTAKACYQCRRPLGPADADAQAPTPAPAVPARWFRERTRVVSVTAVLAVMAVVGYYTLRQSSTVDTGAPAGARIETTGPAGHADAGPISNERAVTTERNAAAGEATPAGAVSSTGNQPPGSPRPTAATPANARTAQTTKAGKEAERTPRPPEPCTVAVAALGLCTPNPVQKKDAPAAAPAIIARPEALNPGSDNAGPCTPAVAALGLCAPIPTQRKE